MATKGQLNELASRVEVLQKELKMAAEEKDTTLQSQHLQNAVKLGDFVQAYLDVIRT